MDNETKKIAVCIPSLRGGGAEKVALTLVNGFVEEGHAVDLVLFQKEGVYLERLHGDVNIVDLRARKVSFGFFKLQKYLQENKPNAVLSFMTHVNLVTLLAVKFARYKGQVLVSEREHFSKGKQGMSRARRKVFAFLMKRLYPKASAVITVSEGVASDLREKVRIKNANIQTIYNPFDISQIKKKANEKADYPFFQNKHTPVILGIGRLTDQKDFPTLVRAFSCVQKKRDAKLIILGEGEKRSELEALVRELGLEEKVSMPGFVENPYAYLRSADLFVLSSTHEGLPGVLVEALICGTPVVSTDCPSGPREILEGGKYGMLVKVGNEKEMINAIMETLGNPREQEVLQKRGHDFSKEKAVERYLDLLI